MNTAHLNPFIRYAGIQRTDTHRSEHISVCYDCRVVYSIDTTGFLMIDGVKYDISNNTVIFLPSGTHYRFFFNKNRESKSIFINCDLTGEFSHLKKSLGTPAEENYDEKLIIKNAYIEELSIPIIKKIPGVSHIFFEIADKFFIKSDFYREESSALLKLCLIEIIKKTRESKYSLICESVIKFIRENYQYIEIDNKKIAENFSYHPYHLSRIMKEETGMSLHKFLMDYRIREAKKILSSTSHSVEEVGRMAGFAQTAYFVKCFREKVGTTPNKYRLSKKINF